MSDIDVRVPPLAPSELDPTARALVTADGPFPGAAGSNLFATLLRHPGLFRKHAPFGSKLLFAGKLPARTREIIVLRTAWLCGSRYEWAHHEPHAVAAGVSHDELVAIQDGPDAEGWSQLDAAVIRACDELVTGHRVTDSTWSMLRSAYDEPQLIEILFVQGNYQLVAGVLNTLGVEIEASVAALAVGMASP